MLQNAQERETDRGGGGGGGKSWGHPIPRINKGVASKTKNNKLHENLKGKREGWGKERKRGGEGWGWRGREGGRDGGRRGREGGRDGEKRGRGDKGSSNI